MNKKIFEVIDLHKYFDKPDGDTLKVLKGIDLSIEEGETVGIGGVSGSGKSTLLHLLGSLDRPTKGKIIFKERDIGKCTDSELSSIRNSKFGFIFQFHYLLPELSVLENVYLPSLIKTDRVDTKRSLELLNEVGLINRKDYYPDSLSGGERQRVAIARALVNEPDIIFADEPTGELDNKNASKVFDLLLDIVNSHGSSLFFVTHNRDFVTSMKRSFNLSYGELEEI